MIGDLYAQALAGLARPEIEYADGHTTPLNAGQWLGELPGDRSLLRRCRGPVLDIGAGPGRLTVALAERGVPALGIDITLHAVTLARSCGALALQRDVFGHLPGAGRWVNVLLADGNIGIGGDPAALLRRSRDLLKPGGAAVIEFSPPGTASRRELIRLKTATQAGAWFPWAWISVDQADDLATGSGLTATETWTDAGRWFAVLSHG